MLVHPVRHSRKDARRDDVGRGLEVGLYVGAFVLLDQKEGAEAAREHENHRGRHPEPHVAKVPSLVDARQV